MPSSSLAVLSLLAGGERCAAISFSNRLVASVAPDPANLLTQTYSWPSGRGHVGRYGVADAAAPFDLNASLAWTWHHPVHRYQVSPVGVNLDEKEQLYVTSLDGIRKFSPGGELLWSYTPEREEGEEMPDTASIYNGRVFCSTTRGRIFALEMETGELVWMTKLSSCDMNNGWVTTFDGVVLTGSDARESVPGKTADQTVTGLNATDGKVLWTYTPQAPVWNFMGMHAGDGTFIFQDYEGRAYRNRLSDGSNIWKNGGMEHTWTDGTALLGPNNVVYAVNTHHMDGAGKDAPGDVSAYNLEDGKLLWSREVPRPPNNQPAVGQLYGRKGLSLVQPIGQQVTKGAPTDVYAMDATTGELQWVFNGPVEAHYLQAGDWNIEAAKERAAGGVRPITLPNPWSAPSIDSAGTVFLGSEEGPIFALRDLDGDGKVEGPQEVSSYDTKAAFSGSSSPAIGKGIMAVASIDALYVFKG